MPRALAVIAAAVLLAVPGCTRGRAGQASAAPARARTLETRVGEFEQRFLLTGELEAVRAEEIVAPRTSSWAITIRWLEADGAVVAAGQKIVEFDSTSIAGDLEEKRLAVVQAESELERARADAAAQLEDRRFAVERSRVELEKARNEASVPAELRPRRDHQEKQLALARAETEAEKAREDLASYQKSSRAELETKRIALEKARREIATAERAVDAFTLRAPRAGILVVADHPWEERKLQVGDTVYVGWTVMRIPDLAAMRVVAQLSDVDDGRIAVGMPAVCSLDAYPDRSFPARVAELTPVAQEPVRESLRRAFRVAIDLEKTDPERMRPGMSVKVVVASRRASRALLAPREGLDLASDPPRALLARGGTREVRLGPCNALDCVVESGLESGTRLRGR